jgi:hypothetical protein
MQEQDCCSDSVPGTTHKLAQALPVAVGRCLGLAARAAFVQLSASAIHPRPYVRACTAPCSLPLWARLAGSRVCFVITGVLMDALSTSWK